MNATMTIAEAFKAFGTAIGCKFTKEQSIPEVLSAISKQFGGVSSDTIAGAAAEIAKVSDQMVGGGMAGYAAFAESDGGTFDSSYLTAKAIGVVIPKGTATISNRSFGSNITYVEVPDSIESISESAFADATNIEKITINKAEGSIEGAPWGAPETAEIIWKG